MATAPLMRNTILEFNGEHLRMLRSFEGNLWQLENVQTGRIYEMLLSDIHEDIRIGYARILLDDELENRSGRKSGKRIVKHRWESLPEAHKDVARRRYSYVSATIKLARSRDFIKPAIAEVAKSLNDQSPPCFSSVLEWLNLYIRGGRDMSALAPRYRQRGAKSNENQELARIVDQQIEDHYLTRERNTLNETLERVAAIIHRKNKEIPLGDPQLPIPSYRYLRTRLSKHSPYEICCARFGKEYADRKYQTVLGYVAAYVPLERVEIDHTVLDLMVIDHNSGLPLGRPTLTVAIDDCTRAVMGFNVGFEPPSYLAVSRCLNHAMLPKTYLKDRYPEIKGTWDCYGAMEYLAVDNGLEFHAIALEDGAARFGITVLYCPRAKPWYKGKVERFIGTMNRGVAHGKPGTTFANIFDRADYDPQKTAVITLNVLDELIHTWIVDYYHQRRHTSIQMKPATAWAEGTQNLAIPLPVDVKDFESAFAIPEERTLDKNGIKLHGLQYNGQACTEYRMKYAYRCKVKIRYIPDNLGYIYLEDPENGEVAKVPVTAKYANYANGLSVWQHKVCSRYAAKHFESNDIVALGEAKLRIAELVTKATLSKKLSKTAARHSNAGKKTPYDSPPTIGNPRKKEAEQDCRKSVLKAEVSPFVTDGINQPTPKRSITVTRAARGASKTNSPT